MTEERWLGVVNRDFDGRCVGSPGSRRNDRELHDGFESVTKAINVTLSIVSIFIWLRVFRLFSFSLLPDDRILCSQFGCGETLQ